ncbi:hypothetical protein ACNVED_03985 [Legionella sp. D16C41]|uniref:hypothetical protein n=1 Tax=Legionella sp. D16C41 TaxID=3402688 RepID=UPI003AF73CDD
MKIHYLILGVLFSCLSHANISMINAGPSDEYQGYVRISLNNQANREITTNSNLIPKEAKFIPAYGSVVLSVPTEVGMQHFRYINGNSGCDFYLDTKRSMTSTGPFDTITFITGVPISSTSGCYVETIHSVNHLTVNFSDNKRNT